MNKAKVSMVMVTALALVGVNKVLALTIEDIETISLKSYPNHFNHSKKLKEYILANGITQEEYEEYVRKNNKYKDSVFEIWESIETSTILLENVLKKSQSVVECYNKILLRNDNDQEALKEFKQSLLSNPSYIYQEFNEIIKLNMNDVFEDTFQVATTDIVEIWLHDKDTFKYANYAGYLQRDLTVGEQNSITSGNGYTLLGISSNDLNEYLSYTKLRRKVQILETRYYLGIESFKDIHSTIEKEYNIDIYKELSEDELLNIRLSALDRIIFDYELAYKLVLQNLHFKGVLKDPSVDNSESPGSNSGDDNSAFNPIVELDKYLGNASAIDEALRQALHDFYKNNPIKKYINLRDKYIYFEYKGVEYNTYARLEENMMIDEVKLKRVLDQIHKQLGTRSVLSKTEMLLLIENKLMLSKLDSSSLVPFKELQKTFNSFGIQLYEVSMEKSKVIDDIGENQDSKSQGMPTYQLDIEMNDTRLSVNSNSDGSFYGLYISRILDMLDIKHVLGLESVMILHDNKIHSIELSINERGLAYKENITAIMDVLGIECKLRVVNQD